ncbi:YniB family protein, partial [Enterobacter hormaechei]|uniref:YniB family protein n=1 Tax=Enterobacter hormaechei TaxID=158836 RepID=UPI00402AAC87
NQWPDDTEMGGRLMPKSLAGSSRNTHQTRFLREGVEDQLILEKAKGPDGMSREQIESRIVVPRHTIFVQFFPLYILPVIIIVAGYFFFTLLGFL